MAYRIDISTPGFQADPYPTYAALRDNSPVCQVEPAGMWAVSRYADIQFVLRHPEIFSSAGFRATFLPSWLEDSPLTESIVLKDPPEHTKLRALVNRAFGPGAMARLETRIRAIVAELVGRLEPDRGSDFVAAFAGPLAATVIADLLGLDPTHYQDFNRWIARLAAITPTTPSSEHAVIRATIAEMSRYLYDVIEGRRRAPTDDMVSDLVRAEIDGHRLSDRDILAFLCVLMAAGIETTGNLLSLMMLALLAMPDVLAQLRAAPDLMPRFVDEVLRHDGPGQAALRLTTTATELASVALPAGAVVACLVASGNRDERQFADPDRFDLTRNAQGVLSFGHGIHYCIGAALARLEARIAFEALFTRFSGFTRAPGEVKWNSSLITRGPIHLPILFLPA
jgi:cytochrome P450